MCIRRKLLGVGNIVGLPIKEEEEGSIDNLGEDRWIQDRLPGCHRGKYGLATKKQEDRSGAASDIRLDMANLL